MHLSFIKFLVCSIYLLYIFMKKVIEKYKLLCSTFFLCEVIFYHLSFLLKMYETFCIYKVPEDLVETSQQFFIFTQTNHFEVSNKFTTESMI